MVKSFSISISYPPLISEKGTPFLSQNRQFQWTNTGNVIYPVIPAYAATLLKKNNYKVYWDDAIAEKISYKVWFKRLLKRKPNLIVIETKTPVIKQHWKIIKNIKNFSKKYQPIIVLMGDHVTALPQESIDNSPVDYVLIGGNYDFLLIELLEKIKNKEKDIPKIFKLSKEYDLDLLPIIDRDLTKWHLYSYNNTNYKYKPGAYIMSGRDCWWGQCTFCSWTTLFPHSSYKRFSVQHTIAEIENLVNNFGVKEVFDDSGTLPTGKWLSDLCHELIKKKLNKKIKISCNMRFGALTQVEYDLMAKAGFRFILYGFESANKNTLIKINKNFTLNDAYSTLKMAKKSKLEPHITIMIGYPWETKKDALNTLNTAKNIFRKGLVNSMQATIIIPYPGTPLFKDCQKNKLLVTEDWDNYDMRQTVIKTPIPENEIKELVQNLFKGILTPNFVFQQIFSIRSFSDIKHLFFYTYKYFMKLKDFS